MLTPFELEDLVESYRNTDYFTFERRLEVKLQLYELVINEIAAGSIDPKSLALVLQRAFFRPGD